MHMEKIVEGGLDSSHAIEAAALLTPLEQAGFSAELSLTEGAAGADSELLGAKDYAEDDEETSMDSELLDGNSAEDGAHYVEDDYTEEAIDESVNFDSEPVMEVEIDGVDYRMDAGMQGTALSISRRASGTWDWSLVGECKWDGISLRCKELDRPLREALAKALKQACSE